MWRPDVNDEENVARYWVIYSDPEKPLVVAHCFNHDNGVPHPPTCWSSLTYISTGMMV